MPGLDGLAALAAIRAAAGDGRRRARWSPSRTRRGSAAPISWPAASTAIVAKPIDPAALFAVIETDRATR